MPVSNDELNVYPANPQLTQIVAPNWFYPDNSFFGFDQPPRYVLNDWSDTRENGTYDTPKMQGISFPFSYSGWTNWVDKFQKDYRFAAMSDRGPLTNLFPEVNDPWMYTEYVYQGTSTVNDLAPAPSGEVLFNPTPAGDGIITPSLIEPTSVSRTISPSGEIITSSEIVSINNQPPTIVNNEVQTIFQLESQWLSGAPGGRTYWQSELEAMGWQEQLQDGTTNTAFTRTNVQRRVMKWAQPVLNSGVRLFREPVWAQSTRWGESQNVPSRVIDLTAPKEYFKPTGLFTGRIVPQVSIQWGIPIYDCLQHADTGEQAAIIYVLPGSTANERIYLDPVTPTGPVGQPDGQFSYPVPPGTYTGAGGYEVSNMPRRNVVAQVTWNSPNYNNGDIVHRGCQFWKGSAGKVTCTYASQNPTFAQTFYDTTTSYTDPALALADIPVPPFFETDDDAVIFASSPNNPDAVNITNLGYTISYNRNGAGAVTSLRVSPTVHPASNTTGFFSNPGGAVTVRTVVRSKRIPYPDPPKCAMYDGPTQANPTRDPKQRYIAAGGKCPFYTPVGQRVVHSYQAVASNGAEWAAMQRGLPAGYKKGPIETAAGQTAMGFAGAGPIGLGLPAAMGFLGLGSVVLQDPFSKGLPQEDNTFVDVTYVPEEIAVGSKSTYYNTKDGQPPQQNPTDAVRIDPTTGFWSLDAEDTTPFGGIDSTFYGMINQINYRVMHNVQHCYRADKCNSIINSPAGNVGWHRGRFSDINFVNHPLHVPGFPAYDGTDKFCHTGDRRCPYNRLDRRAHEFNENYKILLNEILRPFRVLGVTGFSGFGIQEAFIVNGKVTFLGSNDLSAHSGAMCIAVRKVDTGVPVIGHYAPIAVDASGNQYRIFFYYDRPSWDPLHKLSHVMAHIVQFDNANNAQYMACPPSLAATWTSLYGNSTTIPWLIELYDNYQEPSGNLIYCTNSKPFAGGRAPEYKDRSKIGDQILCLDQGLSDTSFMEGATQTNQFGGPTWNIAPVTGQLRRGYWIQKEGEWILDGRPVGYGQGFVDILSRINNKPGILGNRVPIDGEPSVTVNDPNDPTSSVNKSSDYAIVGWTYSNDTAALINYFRSGSWDGALPIDGTSGELVSTLPPDPNKAFLPRERIWYQCDHCGLDLPEEEVNFYKSLQSIHGPAYPLPSGVIAGTHVGDAVMGCPRADGGAVRNMGSYTRFMKCFARGEVDMWAPPGTTVKHDAFFWKAPTLISRAHVDQLLRKLGQRNPSGGGVTFQGLTKQIEQMGRLPVTTVRSYNVGLQRQLVAPWAVPGQTVAQVRQQWSDKLHLLSSDQAYVQRDTANPVLVEVETSWTLQLNDIIQWYRTDPDGYMRRVGVPISACATAPQSILHDPSVLADDAMPDRSNYGDTIPEQRRYDDDLNKWLLGVVTNTIQNFASSPQGHANLWAEMLASFGVDPNLAKPIDPSSGATLDLDERIIAPYTPHNDDGLKMATLTEMKRVRNQILPMLAYSLTDQTYTAGGDYNPDGQAGFQDRFRTVKKSLPVARYGTVEPQILAATSTGNDAYVEWFLGDIGDTAARAYYPTGKIWWRLNQTIGCIKRSGGNSFMHLDTPPGSSNATWSLISMPYTGDDVVSQVLYFIHGRMPMDKEVIKAYLLYTPDDAPMMDAIGCQGQFTGNQSPENLYDGGYKPEESTYKGHIFCYWVHYHGYTTNHESDNPFPYYSPDAKNHVVIGHNDPSYFLRRGTLDDPSTPWLDEAVPTAELMDVNSEEEYEPFVAGGTAQLYTRNIDLLGMSFEDSFHGAGLTQNFLHPWSFGQELQQAMTEHEIWKDISYDTYNKLWERYHVNALATVDDMAAQQSFEYVGSYFRNFIFPREQSAIPGWVNMTGYDTSNRFSKFVSIEQKTVDNSWANAPQVILQASSADVTAIGPSTGSNRLPGGGNGTQQAGSAQKVIDITDVVKGIYNDRVDRYFTCTLGASYDSLFSLLLNKSDTNLSTNPQFHTGYNDPWYFWNYRYMAQAGGKNLGMWLTDPWHHTPIVNGKPATGDKDGNPIQQTGDDQIGRISQVSDWDKQGIVDTGDPSYNKYHPISLCYAANPNPFPQTLPPYGSNFVFDKPAPADDPTGRYWRMVDDQLFTHYFIMDLRSVPYENTRRSWRNQAPTVDASNATCPNPSCFVHEKGWTMGQLLANSQNTWGFGVLPSLTSDHCPNCNTLLTGVIYKPGDGITTAFYNDAPLPDALITAVEVSSEADDLYPAEHHGFVVEYFNSITQQWQDLFAVNYTGTSDNPSWSWIEWENGAWQVKSDSLPPTLFLGCEGAGGIPKNTSISGVHFVSPTGSMVRYRVVRPIVMDKLEPTNAFGSCTPVPGTNNIVVATIGDPVNKYIGRTVTLQRIVGGQPDQKTLTITNAVTNGAGATLTLSASFTTDFTQYQIHWKDYVSRCSKFRVYGYPFAADELVITPPGYVQPLVISPGVATFRLNNWPTKIETVTCTVGESEPVNMTQADTNDPSSFYWTVVEDSFDGNTFLRITEGKWFYDYTSNTISIPGSYIDPNDSSVNSIWDLNSALYNDHNSTFSVKTLPNMLLVQFFTGAGMPIDVPVTSCGAGPSYQLEPDCISFIAGESPNDTASLPPGITSDPMPAMGASVPMKTNNGEPVALHWQVYNHDPMVWDSKNLEWVIGDELGAKEWGRDDIFNVYTGGLGDRVDQIGLPTPDGKHMGQNAALTGKVTGKVTLYGSPNTILSGNLVVYAKAVTQRTYQTPDGPVTMSERTGGYRTGAFTFKLEITDTVNNRRTGLTARTPKVLVYLRERSLNADPIPLI